MTRDPELRRLRWLLVAGFALRIALAPISAWDPDTATFLDAGISTFVAGSPYPAFFFNPPLGVYLQAPLLAILSWFIPPAQFVTFVPTLSAVTAHTSLVTLAVPIPAALFALKLPLILADMATGVVLFALTRPSLGRAAATTVAAFWLLNPLPIWVSAVHGEYDPLGALALVLLAWALSRRWAFGSGAFLGLGVLAKLVPLLALPFVVAYFARPGRGGSLAGGARSLGHLALGATLVVLPFAGVLGGYYAPLILTSGPTVYGGLSLFVVFNPTVRHLAQVAGPAALAASAAGPLFLLQESLGIAAVFGPMVAWLLRSRRTAPARLSPEWAGATLLWPVVGGLLLDASPQSENVVSVLALLLLAAPVLGWIARPAYLALSGAALTLYWALLTPVAYFYPLWVWLGSGAVGSANSVALGYLEGTGPLSQGPLWLLSGVAGGATLFVIWGLAARAGWMGLRLARDA